MMRSSAPNHVWERISELGDLPEHNQEKKVDYYIKRYTKNPTHLEKASYLAHPYLFHIVETLDSRNMPLELALLPMIESCYQPFAISNRGARGLWQMGRDTGKRFGLKQDQWFDEYQDIMTSTNAALDYLEFLHEMFDNDWLLALAAYNAGEGRVLRAISQNKKAKLPTNFWSLNLPKETREFVPKFLAIAHIIKNRHRYPLSLSPIENKPYFSTIQAGSITLSQAARLADMNLHELRRLNPGYRNHSTHPYGPQILLLPQGKANVFETNLNEINGKNQKSQPTKKQPHLPEKGYHVIKPGETLSIIAKKYETTVTALKQSNELKNDIIIAGNILKVS